MVTFPVDPFFDELEESFTVTPPAGTAVTLTGIWDNENSPTDLGNVTVINDSPTVDFKTSECGAVVKKSKVVRVSTNETFYVTDPGRDEEGITTKTLSRTIPQ